ncbi:MAG: hypothetical protein GVY24_01500 [Planctomycetes bacterium]|jgi:hypothetical protein|nr:hypothetical protein [Planctomycetota bacterium]
MSEQTERFEPGTRVRITQQIPQRGRTCWVTSATGVVVRYEQAMTGSWYAHARGERLWLDRLTIRLDDGEITVFNLDRYTHVDVLGTEAEPVDADVSGVAGVVNTEVEGGLEMEVTGHRPRDEVQGEGVADTPSGDLGAPTERA